MNDNAAKQIHPPAWPPPDEDVLEALRRAYASGDWGRYHGQECKRLSEELASFHDVPFASLCSSGTIAIELALRGMGIGPGDEVLISAYDFPGNFRAIEAIGAKPVLVDTNAANANIDVDVTKAACSSQTKAVIVSHLHGSLVPMRAAMDLAGQCGLAVVEDACQCPGAWIDGQRAGAWGDVGVMSFGGSKLLTAGRGGALLARDAAVVQRIKVFRERGNDAFPMSELQAAVLHPQLQKLDERNQKRFEAVRLIQAELASIPGLRAFSARQALPGGTQDPPPASKTGDNSSGRACFPAYYKFGIWYEPELSQLDRDQFSAAARQSGVALDPGFRGFAARSSRRCRKSGSLSNAKRAANNTLIWHHPVLLEPDEALVAVCDRLRRMAPPVAL